MRAKGLPLAFLHPPPHLAADASAYADPSEWASLRVLSHDEKDMKAQAGWLVDLGDGETQHILAAYEDARSSTKTWVGALRALPAQQPMSASAYAPVHSTLHGNLQLIERYRSSALETTARWEKRIAALQSLLRKTGPGHKDHERRVKSMGDLNKDIAKVQAFDRRVTLWAGFV